MNNNNEEKILNIPVFSITPDKNQPRKIFDEEALQDLANSIANNGVIVPIIVKSIDHQKYQIIAGERRWRASILANQETIPAIVRDTNELTMHIQALIENVQRDDLNALEEALAYQELVHKFNLSHAKLAEQIGKSRATITNSLRLLKLPESVQNLLLENKITNGHAKALLGLETDWQIEEVAYQIVVNNLSVRETENLVNQRKKSDKDLQPELSKDETKNLIQLENQIKKIENDLSKKLSSKVKINLNKGQNGQIKIKFADLDDLERVLDLLND